MIIKSKNVRESIVYYGVGGGNCKGKFCTSKISTLVARDPLLVWIPAFAGMTIFNGFLDSASLGMTGGKERFSNYDFRFWIYEIATSAPCFLAKARRGPPRNDKVR